MLLLTPMPVGVLHTYLPGYVRMYGIVNSYVGGFFLHLCVLETQKIVTSKHSLQHVVDPVKRELTACSTQIAKLPIRGCLGTRKRKRVCPSSLWYRFRTRVKRPHVVTATRDPAIGDSLLTPFSWGGGRRLIRFPLNCFWKWTPTCMNENVRM